MRTADVEHMGELSGMERDQLLARSYATLMPGAWPEPFGLVAIESLACGTPVLARPVGALPEIVREGIDGWFGADPPALAARVEGRGTARSDRHPVIGTRAVLGIADGRWLPGGVPSGTDGRTTTVTEDIMDTIRNEASTDMPDMPDIPDIPTCRMGPVAPPTGHARW